MLCAICIILKSIKNFIKMRTLNIYAALFFSIFAINFSFAQTSVKKETIKVWGNCGICKKNIEKAAKVGGATTADWNKETKVLNVSYNSSRSNSEKIQKAIAASGYDTQDFKADDNTYNKLMSCCQYDRNTAFTSTSGMRQVMVTDEMFTCPMHPEVKSDKPGKCPKCGMTLLKQKMTDEQMKMMKEGTYIKPKE
jgi:copper chaperone CopZ